MKRFALVLALLALSIGAPVFAQDVVEVVPTISSTAVTACTTFVGKSYVTHNTSDTAFVSVYAGQTVYGVGVQYGTTVLTSDSVDYVTLSKPITQGGAKTLYFGVFNGTDYSSGDWVGFPFLVQVPGSGSSRELQFIQIVDNADMLDDVDVIFFNEYSDTLGADNAAASVVAADASKVVGGIALTGDTDVGSVRTAQASNIGMILPRVKLYARLIARAALDPTAVNNLRLRFGFR